jgi:glutathione S-transferase
LLPKGEIALTNRQALTAPFILRIYALAKHGLLPQSIPSAFDELPNFSKWAAEVVKQDSVTYIWDEETTVSGTKKKIESLKAQAASK